MNTLLTLLAPYRSRNPFPVGPVEPASIWLGVLLLAVIFGVAMWLFYGNKGDKSWDKGLVPPDFPASRDNLLEIYIAVGALIVHRDPVEMVGKLGYINAYFRRHFSDVYYDFKDSYRYSLRHPVKIPSLAAWLRKHLKREETRLKVVEFVVGLAYYDGSMNEAEYSTIRKLVSELHLDPSALDRILEPYVAQQRQREQRRETASEPVNRSAKATYAAILGVDVDCTPEELKKAYRSLVMLYHPDKYQNDTPEMQQKAAEKFLRIQEAYEYFEQIPVH